MNNIYKIAYKKINSYKLTKVQKAMVYRQIKDVLDQTEEETYNENNIDELIEEVFEYNDIVVITKKAKEILPAHTFWGILLVLLAIFIITPDYFVKIYVILPIISIYLLIYFLVKRYFFMAVLIICAYLAIFFGIGGISLVFGLILGYIGIKLITKKEENNIEYYNMDDLEVTKKIENEHSQKYSFKNIKKDEEVIFLNNKFSGMEMEFTNEQISYINIQNDFGGCELNLTNFEFLNGDLIINVSNKCGGLNIYLNNETDAEIMVSSKLGGVDFKRQNYEKNKEKKYKVYIQGDNALGGISIY